MAIALPIAVPIAAILLNFAAPESAVWAHLRETVLLEYLLNTVALLMMVAILALLLGAGCAWLVATKEFPGRRVFAWALILPFAAPAYVVAYAYADLLAYAGPLQAWLRELDLLREGLPAIRSLPGAGLVLGFTLYPYVYLLAYVAFADRAGALAEAARTLGASPRRAFVSIALPQARPAIAGGLALALMEAAADFGVVDFFGVPTLTNGIFRTWYAQGEHQAAMQLAGWLFLVVAALVVLEQLARRGLRANPVSRNMPPPRTPLAGWRGPLAALACAVPIVLGLLLPAATLLRHALVSGDPSFGATFISYVANSVAVATIAAALAGLCALWLNYALRLQALRSPQSGAPLMRRDQPASPRAALTRFLTAQARLLRLGVRTATLGYAIPGMVLAVGLIGPLTAFDKQLAGWLESILGIRTGLLLTGSVAALVFVYLARFLTVAFNSLEGGMARVHPNYDSAARSLGSSPGGLLARVHLPLLTPALLTAMLLVFVDVIKELPATLILRPFNFETLATRAYRLASDERLAEASTASLMILAVGLVPTLALGWRNFAARGSR